MVVVPRKLVTQLVAAVGYGGKVVAGDVAGAVPVLKGAVPLGVDSVPDLLLIELVNGTPLEGELGAVLNGMLPVGSEPVDGGGDPEAGGKPVPVGRIAVPGIVPDDGGSEPDRELREFVNGTPEEGDAGGGLAGGP